MKKSRNAYVLTLMYQKKILKNTGIYNSISNSNYVIIYFGHIQGNSYRIDCVLFDILFLVD